MSRRPPPLNASQLVGVTILVLAGLAVIAIMVTGIPLDMLGGKLTLVLGIGVVALVFAVGRKRANR